MPMVRIEAVKDTKSDFYLLEIYNPSDAEQPFVTTEPRYRSAAAAENDAIAILAAVASAADTKRRDNAA
jgi:hypothetical protein